MLQQEAVTQFRGQFRGELIEPGDARYESARQVYNAMISREVCRPIAITVRKPEPKHVQP